MGARGDDGGMGLCEAKGAGGVDVDELAAGDDDVLGTEEISFLVWVRKRGGGWVRT